MRPSGLIISITFLLSALPIPVWAQSVIKGKLLNAENGEPAAFVQVLLYPYQSGSILTYDLSDKAGRFELKVPAANGIYSLKTHSLVFESVEKEIVMAKENAVALELTISLSPKAHELTVATVVDKRPPIIVKEDTIIYDVSHWSDTFDESLEAVLKKIPGMEVLADGAIKVKGKRVDKVLIDGEEISDGGAALFTRSLSPDRVASIEVRLNEKNEKLRESLLSQNEFVTLDIKLRDDFEKRLFGQLSATAGAQDEARLGGVAKIFSLNERLKLQLLGERDAFGDQSLSLANIKNLGAEAYTKIFEVPADFAQLRANPEFNQELYGLREYTEMDLSSAGLTGKANLSPDLALYFGTYNVFLTSGQQNRFTQSYLDNSQYTFKASQFIYSSVASSKNKVELTFDRENWKVRYNFNFVWNDQAFRRQQRLSNAERFDFSDALENHELYHNLFAEHRFSDALGLQANLLYSRVQAETARSLRFNSQRYASFFQAQGLNATDIEQLLPERQSRLLGRLYLQLMHKLGSTRAGFRALRDELQGSKQVVTEEGQAPTRWASDWQTRRFQQLLPFLSHQFALERLHFNAQIGYAFNFFDTHSLGDGLQSKPLLEYKANLSFDLDDDNNIRFNLNRSTAYFPIRQLIPGWELRDFQSIAIPGQFSLEPQPQLTMELSATSFSLGEHGVAIELAGIMGQAFNAPALRLNPQGLIEAAFHQLPSYYQVGIAKIGKTFQQLPLQIKLEGSIIHNHNANLNQQEEAVSVGTQIRAIDLRAFSTFQDKTYDFEGRIKRSGFYFFNPDGTRAKGQQIWNAYLTYKQKLLSGKLQLRTTVRTNRFVGAQRATLNLIDAALQYRHKKSRFFLNAHNLLDSNQFLLQEITPVFFTDIQRAVFGRFVKIGCTVDLN